MKHTYETKVYYADTDAYGVVWHGSYLRWLERGRVELCNQLGLNLIEMKKADVLLPVTNMNVRYKASARLNDNVIIETWIKDFNGLSVIFKQTIRLVTPNPTCALPQSTREGKLLIEATFDVVAVNEEGRLYRRMPDDIAEKLKKGIVELCPASV